MAFARYFVLCLVLSGGSAVAAVALWSNLGWGLACIELAREASDLAAACVGLIALALLALYLLDFFAPPHLPGRYLRLREGRDAVGCCLLRCLGLACYMACVFSAKLVPSMPLLATTFLSPVFVIAVHQALISEETVENLSLEELAAMDFEARIAMLKELTEREGRQQDFCAAASSALALVGTGCLIMWVPWATSNSLPRGEEREESGLLFVLWVAPLVVGLSNVVFALFVSLRVVLNGRYKATHSFKNRLIVANVVHASQEDVERHRSTILAARNSFTRGMTVRMSPGQVEKYLTQHVSCLWLLSAIMKGIGCAFVVMLGAISVTFQLVTAVGPTTSAMVQSFISAFFLTFVSFVAVCFGRLWQAMSEWLAEFPLWSSLLAMTQTAWARACLVLLALPVLPGALALSALNQCVRRRRGLDGTNQAPGRPLLTQRVRNFLDGAREWDWVPIVWWWYVLAWAAIVLKLTPLCLNLLLAWMNSVLGGMPFGIILAATFALGMVLFMLPPVPGPPIYLFGGVVIPDACPLGFWWGTAICIALSFLLKLTACAAQQKLIGERLGGSLQVRRLARVHRPLIRAIEMVLQKPGLSFGKCMILCGGPDWPVSVIAGILQLSLPQCLLGTLPVIVQVVPLCLTGSFYLKRDQGQLWVRAGNLMFSLTALMSVLFCTGMGWAVQDVYDKRQYELTRPREEFLELEWHDYRADFIAEKLRHRWGEMPAPVRTAFLGGALGLTLVVHAALWRSSLCFGSFSVTGDVRELSWFGPDGLVRVPGALALAVALVSSGGFAVQRLWSRRRSRSLLEQASREADLLEALWKDQRLRQARDVAGNLDVEKRCLGDFGKRHSAASAMHLRCAGSGGGGLPEEWQGPPSTEALDGRSLQLLLELAVRDYALQCKEVEGKCVFVKE